MHLLYTVALFFGTGFIFTQAQLPSESEKLATALYLTEKYGSPADFASMHGSFCFMGSTDGAVFEEACSVIVSHNITAPAPFPAILNVTVSASLPWAGLVATSLVNGTSFQISAFNTTECTAFLNSTSASNITGNASGIVLPGAHSSKNGSELVFYMGTPATPTLYKDNKFLVFCDEIVCDVFLERTYKNASATSGDQWVALPEVAPSKNGILAPSPTGSGIGGATSGPRVWKIGGPTAVQAGFLKPYVEQDNILSWEAGLLPGKKEIIAILIGLR